MMKTKFLAGACVLLLALTCIGQTVRLPITLTVDLPAPVQTNVTFVITNVYYTNITQVFVTVTNASTALVTLTNDLVDAKLGQRLLRTVTVQPSFVLTNFAPGSFTTLYWSNPDKLPLFFPTNLFWLGLMPTNQIRGAVLFEQVGAEIWATP